MLARRRAAQSLRWIPPGVLAALLIAVAAASGALMNALVRLLAADLHPFEIAFFRNFFGLIAVLPLLGSMGFVRLRLRNSGRLVLSSLGHVVAMLTFFTALTSMPLTDAAALSFTTPLFATAGAALFLGEIVRARRWTAVGVGFLGVIIVMRPGVAGFTWAAGLALFSSMVFAAVALVIKQMTQHERTVSIVFYQSLFTTCLAALPAAIVWRLPVGSDWALLALLGALGTFGWLLFTQAYVLAEASALTPYDFTRLPFTALVAYALFDEVPDRWTWIGGAVIFASTVYIAHREAAVARMRRTAAASETRMLE
ncbi:MAG: DMT family transporter [Proteobacteria bacterium]|nr:DMT family transporter [Pseudomonadota bacterium]MBI3498092.1 DMT family transporter [Pseudomonadota bacterium]